MGDKMSLCWQLTLIGILIAVSHNEKSTELIRLLKTFKEIMTIKPLNDRVLIEPAKAEEVVGGIIIPDSAKEKPLKGKVRAAGNGTKDEEMIVKPGDIVLYGKYAGNEIEIDGEKLLMMRQNDILAIVMD
jgi:chaperonin GroES